MIKMPFLPLKHKYPKMGKNTIKIKKNRESKRNILGIKIIKKMQKK